MSGETSSHRSCLDNVAKVLQTKTARYLADAVGAVSGRPFDASRVKCIPHSSRMGTGAPVDAGYVWGENPFARRGDIIVFEDKATSVGAVERSLRHELIHAFDDARGVIDPFDCYHQACSEIRAARLSGDCFFAEEAKRGHMDVLSGGRRCVERRAGLAVSMNPLCRNFGDRAVNRMMPKCYTDYDPFVAPLYKE